MKNICLDTNTIISHIFLSEPYHSIIKNYMRKNMKSEYYYTESILTETENIYYQKHNLILNIFNDFTDFLEDYHNKFLLNNNIITKFVLENHDYYYKGKKVSKRYIETILYEFLKEICEDNIDGFDAFKRFERYLTKMSSQLFNHKENFYKKLTLIPKHSKEYPTITNTLTKNGSHYEDNEIILDIYEYVLINNIKFTIVTFDKSFYNSLKKCKFNFINNIIGILDLK